MSLKIIKFQPKLARFVLVAIGILSIAMGWYFIKWNFANTIASRLDTTRPESKLVADWLTQVSPSDPQTHYGAAVVYEKTFDTIDIARSVHEYEMAAALWPNNYMIWLALGKSRSLNGDVDGAEKAFARALELAPNYASVQWIYGNSLLRQGKTEEAFVLIAKAAASYSEYAKPAATIALQIFDGDLDLVRKNLGDTEITNSSLAVILPGQGRFDEAFEAWSKLSGGGDIAARKQLGESFVTQLVAAKKFQLAARVTAELSEGDSDKPVIGQINDGGFENGVKLRNAGIFEWQIAEGAQPQIGIGEGQSHSGKYNLWMIFNTFETAAFRSVSQTVPVQPGAAYQFEVFYRSDLKTNSSLKWEIVDAFSNVAIASTPPMAPAAEWTPLGVQFTAPATSDGIVIRLTREGCIGPACPINGKLSLDDFSLRRL